MKVINKSNISANAADTFSEKINGTLIIPMEKSDIMTLTLLLLTFSTMIPGERCHIHIF